MTTSAGGAFELLHRAIGLHQAGRIDDAAPLYQRVIDADPKQFDALYHLGMIEAQRGNFGEARRLVGRALKIDAKSADVHSNYACVLNALDRHEDALASCDKALALDPRMPAAHSNRGNTLQSLKRYQDAVASYDRALTINPRDPVTLTNRGNALLALDRPAEALASYDRALAIAPGHVPALSMRGQVLGSLRRYEEALAAYDRALGLNPGDVVALENRGNVLSALNRHDEALASYDRALAIKPDDAIALTNRGNPLFRLKRYEEAIASYDRAIAIGRDNAGAYNNRGAALNAAGRWREAIASYQQALRLKPNYGEAQFGLCMAQLPVLYADEAEIVVQRQAYTSQLEALCRNVDRWNPADLVKGIGTTQPFFLAYQGYNDRDLQALYGSLICQVMAKFYPPATLPAPPRPEEPIRVGVVTGFFRHHTVWKLIIRGWIEQFDRRRFRVSGYYTGTSEDAETRMAAAACERFVRGPLSTEQWRNAILADAPHVLLYPEIGMDPIAVQLAAQRLAPVQCNSFGHPDTSGCPTLDYFLSSELMEPPDADAHYTERLIRLPNLSFYYEPYAPPPVPVTRAGFGLREGATVYWSAQSLYKYLPQHDRVYPSIAKAVGDCQFVFIENDGSAEFTNLFRRRLEHAFAATGLKAADHCVFLPRLTPPQFVAAAGLCDVMLDSIGWTGGNTTLECLNHDLPVVTMVGPFMRGRTTLGFLTRMDVTETVTGSIEDYVAVAARLGLDAAWRAEIKGRIAHSKHKLYRDRTCIAALEDFLERTVRHSAVDGRPAATA